MHLLGRRARWRGAFPGLARQDRGGRVGSVSPRLVLAGCAQAVVPAASPPGAQGRPVRVPGRAEGRIWGAYCLLGGDIRQKLLPLSRSVPKPGFRSAKGFLLNLNTGRGKTRNVCILLGELPSVALCIFLRCGWRLVAGCSVWCFSLLVRSIPGRVGCFSVACLNRFSGCLCSADGLSSTN